MCNCRFAEKLGEDNLSLQWEIEALRNEIATLSHTLQKMHHETKLMGSQLRNAVSSVTACRSCHVSLDESLRNDFVSHSSISNLQHALAQLQSRYESQCSLLSKFIPFVKEAVLVEHAANVVFELMQSCTNPNNSEIDGSEIPSSVRIASSPTCSVAPGPVASQALLNNTKSLVQDEETNDKETNDTFAKVAGHCVAVHLQESSFVSPTQFHGHDYDDTRASSHPAAFEEVEVGHCKSSENSDIHSYRDLLLSYEHELIAAWSREADLQMELQSKCATFDNRRNRREDYQVFQQARSLSPHAMSPCDLEIPSTTNMIILEADKLMLETRIPSSDTFIDDMFKLRVHEIFHVLTRQITDYNSMNRVVQNLV